MIKIDKLIKERIFSKKNVFLKYIYFFLNKIFSTFKYRKSFSQGSMDLILQHIFKDKKNGIYVDVGCQHPIKNNNTYLLFKRGWHGINIDLDKTNIELFNFNRPNDFNFNEAISDKVEELDLYFFHQKSPINTLDVNVSNKQESKIEKKFKIKTNTLTNILERTPIKNIDVLTIDIEGFELKALKGLNFDKFRPNIIIAEFLDLKAHKWEIPYNNFENIYNSDLYKFVISKNYKLVNWVNGDLVFANKDI
tara:strand:+ start:1600 stop:2349 length:750 start_codon:yes stop_codon:yes gene_type:complete